MRIKNTLKKILSYCLLSVLVISCQNEEFKDMPQSISLNDLLVEPVNGGCDIKWTPNPDDKNFVFLSVEFTDHENKRRCQNVSRYGSSLVVPNDPDDMDNKRTPEVVMEIRDLVNQTYTFDFYAYNMENNRISLGNMQVTPKDYTENLPDSIYGVNVKAGKGWVEVSWNELPVKPSSTLDKIFFKFMNVSTQELHVKEYEPGIRHDRFDLPTGIYDVVYGTKSEKGKTWESKIKNPVEVITFHTYWDASDKINWIVTGTSVQDSEGPYRNLIDGKKETYWASNWGHTQLPYEIIVELDRVMDVCGVMMQQRQNCAPGWHRCVGEFEIYTKEKAEDAWKNEPDYKGKFADNTEGDHLERQDFTFGTIFKAKFVKIKFTKAMFSAGDGIDGNGHNICMAEFGIFEDIVE